MSIQGAVSELNKEIERLTKIRDSLLAGGSLPMVPAPKLVGNTSAPVARRKLSVAARKKISEANKARWAAIRKAKAPVKAK